MHASLNEFFLTRSGFVFSRERGGERGRGDKAVGRRYDRRACRESEAAVDKSQREDITAPRWHIFMRRSYDVVAWLVVEAGAPVRSLDRKCVAVVKTSTARPGIFIARTILPTQSSSSAARLSERNFRCRATPLAREEPPVISSFRHSF